MRPLCPSPAPAQQCRPSGVPLKKAPQPTSSAHQLLLLLIIQVLASIEGNDKAQPDELRHDVLRYWGCWYVQAQPGGKLALETLRKLAEKYELDR